MTLDRGVASPRDHAVTFYDLDDEFVAAVAPFVAEGLRAGERVLIAVTEAHRVALEHVLAATYGIDAEGARRERRLASIDADSAIDNIMVDGLPSPTLFETRIAGVIESWRAAGYQVRVFGEIVARLWDQGNVVAALELESLWNELAQYETFSLLCAYPTSTVVEAPLADIARMCQGHSAVLAPASYADPAAEGDPSVELGVHRSEVFVPVPEAVAALRRFVIEVLELWDERHLVFDAALVASEMATNAVRHGESPFRVSVGRYADMVRIEIEDVGPGWPAPRDAPVDAADGRGLAIVRALADRVGCDALPGGKIAWAELPRRGAGPGELAG